MSKSKPNFHVSDNVVVVDAMCSNFSDFLLDNFMLVTDSYYNNIYQVSLSNGSSQSLFVSRPTGTNPLAVAYDPTTYDVYYTDNGALTKSISKYSLLSKNFITVYEDVKASLLYLVLQNLKLGEPGAR